MNYKLHLCIPEKVPALSISCSYILSQQILPSIKCAIFVKNMSYEYVFLALSSCFNHFVVTQSSGNRTIAILVKEQY